MRDELNRLGSSRTPCFFFLGFDTNKSFLVTLDNQDKELLFDIDGFKNFTSCKPANRPTIKNKTPISFDEYKNKFDTIIEQIKAGNTYILNLTAPTNIEIEGSLEDIFYSSDAKFKLLLADKMVIFSPERFIKISNNTISTFPMKGTCAHDDASLVTLMRSKKEHAEHTMVVDLLRNDLSMVAQDVSLVSFREAISIEAGNKKLYQTISHIQGSLEDNWQDRLGDILHTITPAGSISGAPKHSTLDIIKSTEEYERGYFSGVFGYFDGQTVDSGVAIRYIEKSGDKYTYKSGGGITLDSDVHAEYEEMIEKIYIPSL